jgi:hypothetical protein
MVRHRKIKRGGDKIVDIQSQLDSIQQQVNELKGSKTTEMEETIVEEPVKDNFEEPVDDIVKEEVVKSWVDDKNKKFRDGAGGRVSLSFSRIMTLLDNNINKGNDKKDWATIKQELKDANSVDEVQDVIDKFKISFSSNMVAGTRKKRRGGKRRTRRRY